MNRKLKIGVVGAGSMGTNHIRLYSELKDVAEVLVFDPNQELCTSVCKNFQAQAVADMEALLTCDAISIAAPTELHAEIGEYFLSKGKHCLIEKPLAFSYQDAQMLVQTAEKNNVKLMVGHVEHFNPAFIELKKIVDCGINIHSIDVRRLSYARPNFDKSVDVIFDLMIHDLELIIALLGNDVQAINAHHISGSDPWGHVTALMKTKTGVVVNISASRITQKKIRTMILNTDIGFFSLDFIKQELTLYKSGLTQKLNPSDNSLFKLDMSVDKILLRNEEPLRNQLKHFLACIINDETPLVSGINGRDSIALAERIKKAASMMHNNVSTNVDA